MQPVPSFTAATVAAECLAVRVRVLSRAVTALYDEALRPHGLKVTQMNLLVALSLLGASRPSPLCDLLHLERSTFSRNIERMRRQGWVAMSPHEDARTHLVSVTETGRALLEQAKPGWDAAQAQARELLGDEGAHAVLEAGNSLMGVRAGVGDNGRSATTREERP
jgi:DNA-binding MarR family transcriptional regulator